MTEIHDLSAAELIELYRNKALSPIEATRAVLAHIERWEPTRDFFVLLRTMAQGTRSSLGHAHPWSASWSSSHTDGQRW